MCAIESDVDEWKARSRSAPAVRVRTAAGVAAALFVMSACTGDITNPAGEPQQAAVRHAGPSFASATSNTGTVARGGPYNLRSGPGTNYALVGTIPSGTRVTISCTSRGTTVTGVYGTTNLWDKLSTGAWISDALVYTGTSAPVAGPCSTSGGPVIGPVPVVAAPVLSPNPTNPPSTAWSTVKMSSSTQNATIRYTTNGTEPGENSQTYSSPITLFQTTTLKARAFKAGMANSAVTTVTYTIVPTFFQPRTKEGALFNLKLWLIVDWCHSPQAFELRELMYANVEAQEAPIPAALQFIFATWTPFGARSQVDQEVNRYAARSISEIDARRAQLEQRYKTTDLLLAFHQSWCSAF